MIKAAGVPSVSQRAPQRGPATSASRGWLRRGIVVATGLGAILSFLVQPLISQFLLPQFGGSASVWNIALVFFQTTLVAGYAYAHFLSRRLSPRAQVSAHLVLLVCGLAAVWLLVRAPELGPGSATPPELAVLGVLAVTVGLPYLLLAATSPLLQAWYSQAGLGTPYPLYSVSNLGSLIGLLAYPFALEPAVGLVTQAALWTTGFVLFCITLGAVGIAYRQGQPTRNMGEAEPSRGTEAPVDWWQVGWWTGLAAVPSMLLHAVTSHICTEVAPMPLLWVVPLALYLVTFIAAFGWPTWRFAGPLAVLAAVATVAMSACLRIPPQVGELTIRLSVAMTLLFTASLLFHGELVRRKPSAGRLTGFYLAIAVGGAAGAILVSLVAPLVFPARIELHILVAFCPACCAVLLLTWKPAAAGHSRSARHGAPLTGLRFGRIAAGLLGIATAYEVYAHARLHNALGVIACARDFYGAVVIQEAIGDEPDQHVRLMRHGVVNHGMQFQSPGRRRQKLMYYHPGTGIGWAFARLPESPRRVGLVGMGAGTLAGYGRPGDTFRFYEISPVVARMAREYFTYIQDSSAQVEEVLGDARLVLEQEAPQKFDLLVLDAFTGDSVPMHLLTREAFAVYARHIKPTGMVAAHISNNFVDLRPVVEESARAVGWSTVTFDTRSDMSWGNYAATWAISSGEAELIQRAAREATASGAVRPRSLGPVLWTDDFSSLLHIWK